MRRLLSTISLALALFAASGQATEGEFSITVPMESKGRATYYVKGEIGGHGDVDLLVDTGSGYLTINEVALEDLLREKRADYRRNLRGVLADGRELEVPVYSISALRIGEQCWLNDVEAAVFPGKTRFILGLSALAKAGPFIFRFDPPTLVLSRCRDLAVAG
jgi:predicted aspartyl protease